MNRLTNDQCKSMMSRIQIVDLNTSSEDEETGGVVISKHEMRRRFRWLSTKVVVLQVKQEVERTDTIEDEAVQMQTMQGSEPGDILESVNTLEVVEKVEDYCGEMNNEWENNKEQVYHIDNKEESPTKPEDLLTIFKREVEQLATAEVTKDIETTKIEPQESNTPVEENEEAMLPEDGILLTYILKRGQEDVEIQVVDDPTKPETKATDSIVDIPMSDENHKISENLQKLSETEKSVENIAVILSTSKPVMEDKEISEEERMEGQPSMINMFDKLTKAVSKLGSEVSEEKSLKLPAIDLMLRIQAALDDMAFSQKTVLLISLTSSTRYQIRALLCGRKD